ncbi:MAG: hypothetical protein IKU01_05410 [Bacteroidales bacterium]|nr:hypothetical protein [Bacteroidales bacterium]
MRNKFLLIILIFILFTGCSRNHSRSSRDVKSVETKEITQVVNQTEKTDLVIPQGQRTIKPTINIYIENSGSMNGFINQTSEYQDAIQNMLAWLEYYYDTDNIKLHYINERIIYKENTTNATLLNFAQKMLSPAEFKSNGNGASTNLNNIIKMILDATDNKTISILLSDNIYSISGTQTAPVLLAECKNKTLQAFLGKSKELKALHQQLLSTTVIQLHSQFNGNYWDYKHPTGKASQKLNCKRPYYMCVIGVDELLSSFNENFDVQKMNGYKNKYTLTEIDELNPECCVLVNTYKTGRFRKTDCTTIREAMLDKHKNVFAMAIAVDLKDIPLSDDEKCDVKLFEVTEDYVIDEIIKVEDAAIAPIDKQATQNCTHIIKVSTLNRTIPSFTLKMKRELPEWVIKSSSVDDTKIGVDNDEQNKTFGLWYFVTGIKDAYDKGDENYFEINITINK